jgi:hypothetical protein
MNGRGTASRFRPTYHPSATTRRAVTEEVVDQRDLVERAMRGDHDAFAVLVGRFVARLAAGPAE